MFFIVEPYSYAMIFLFYNFPFPPKLLTVLFYHLLNHLHLSIIQSPWVGPFNLEKHGPSLSFFIDDFLLSFLCSLPRTPFIQMCTSWTNPLISLYFSFIFSNSLPFALLSGKFLSKFSFQLPSSEFLNSAFPF